MAECIENLKARRRNRSNLSSESSIESPEAKKTRNSSVERISDNEGDEVLTALNMAGNLNEKLQQILKKLEKLDTIEKSTSKIESSLKELEIRMAKMEEFKITASKDIQELKDGLSYVGDQVQEAKLDEVSKNLTQIDELKKESSSKLEELTTQNLYLEAYSRRENIKFFNIEETPRENVEEVLRDFLEEELGHQDAREIEIQRVHRVGKTKGDKPRPILARFLRYKDCESILSMGRRLRDTDYQMFTDLPYEIIRRRRLQMDNLRTAKLNNIPAYFSKSQPDKLYIRGKVWPVGRELEV